MPQPDIGSFAQRIYDALAPLAWDDENQQWALAYYIAAGGTMFQEIEDYAANGRGYRLVTNYIENGGFEVNADGWGFDITGFSSVVGGNNEQALFGNNSAKATAAGTDPNPYIYHYVAVNPQTKYTGSIYLRSPIASARAIIFFYTTGGGDLGYEYTDFTIPTNEWTRLSKTVVTPIGCTKVLALFQVFGATAGQIVYFDGGQLEDGELTDYIDTNGLVKSRSDAYDTGNNEIGWSGIIDLTRVPGKALPWLAQFVGIEIPDGLTEPQQREYVADLANWRRGTRLGIIAAIKATLTGNKSVLFHERVGGQPYQLGIATYDTETPDPALTESIIRERQKPAGIVLTYSTLAGQDYQTVLDNHPLYQDVKDDYATYADVKGDTP